MATRASRQRSLSRALVYGTRYTASMYTFRLEGDTMPDYIELFKPCEQYSISQAEIRQRRSEDGEGGPCCLSASLCNSPAADDTLQIID